MFLVRAVIGLFAKHPALSQAVRPAVRQAVGQSGNGNDISGSNTIISTSSFISSATLAAGCLRWIP